MEDQKGMSRDAQDEVHNHVQSNGVQNNGAQNNGAQRSAQLPVVIVGGFHEAVLTEQWVRSLPTFVQAYIAPTSPVLPLDILHWLTEQFGAPATNQLPIVGIGFSAGVVGLAGALAMWQQQGGNVGRLIAVDGWGVPIVGLPVCRMSHDRFTHLSTLPLDVFADASDINFYADPAVAHLRLWGEPEAAHGRQVARWELDEKAGLPMSAADFLRRQLRAEWNRAFNWHYANGRSPREASSNDEHRGETELA
ncbi:MAG: hypothetical protein AAFO06_16985 [Cyanobacteria bacterium J06597_16]